MTFIALHSAALICPSSFNFHYHLHIAKLRSNPSSFLCLKDIWCFTKSFFCTTHPLAPCIAATCQNPTHPSGSIIISSLISPANFNLLFLESSLLKNILFPIWQMTHIFIVQNRQCRNHKEENKNPPAALRAVVLLYILPARSSRHQHSYIHTH